MYLRQDKLQIQSEHHIKLSFRYSVYSPLGRVDFLLQSNQASGWSTEGTVYYFGSDLLALSKPLAFPSRVHACRVYFSPCSTIQQLVEKPKRDCKCHFHLCF